MMTIAMPSLTHWSAIFATIFLLPRRNLVARKFAGYCGLQTR